MIFNATGRYDFGLPPRMVPTAFDDRAWRPIGGGPHDVDLERLKRWLGGTSDVHQNPPPGPGPRALLIAAEFLREVKSEPGGNAVGLRNVLATFRRERPDILLLVYDPSLRYAPEIPGQRDRMIKELDRRLSDPLEREIWSLTGIWCPDWYWMGMPKKTACPVCAAAGRLFDSSEVDLPASIAKLPEYIKAQEEVATIVETETRVEVIPTVHERWHAGHGMKPDVFMSVEAWDLYLRTVLAFRKHAAWWSAARVVGTRENNTPIYEWPKAGTMEPFGAAAIKAISG